MSDNDAQLGGHKHEVEVGFVEIPRIPVTASHALLASSGCDVPRSILYIGFGMRAFILDVVFHDSYIAVLTLTDSCIPPDVFQIHKIEHREQKHFIANHSIILRTSLQWRHFQQ
jgi:hypothetical protein